MNKNKTLRLNWARWQGGMNPDYILGQHILKAIVPESCQTPSYTICCLDSDTSGSVVDAQSALQAQEKQARAILEEANPDQVVILGGDCSVSQTPFAWLREKYGDSFGILWLDAHPDISKIGTTRHFHEMPVANLLGLNPGNPLTEVKNPVLPDRILYAGLIEKDLRPKEKWVKELNIQFLTPEQITAHPHAVKEWIQKQGIQKIAIHWDVDVLSPYDYYSQYPAEPYKNPEDFFAAIGRLSLAQVNQILQDAQSCTDLVGLTIAENLPWDAIRLNEVLSSLDIMK